MEKFSSIASASKSGTEGKTHQECKVKSSSLHDVFIEGCKLMTYMALIDLDIATHREWTNRMQSCLDLDRHPWMVTSHVNIAEAGYLDSVPALPWPGSDSSDTELDSLDSICRQISSINLVSDNAGFAGTPVAQKRTTSRICAPVKKKRGGKPVAFVDVDTPAVPQRDKQSIEADSKQISFTSDQSSMDTKINLTESGDKSN